MKARVFWCNALIGAVLALGVSAPAKAGAKDEARILACVQSAAEAFKGCFEKIVAPADAGTQCLCNPLKTLGSGIRRNDEL